MTSSTDGVLVLRLEIGESDKDGLYTARTHDGGRTWSDLTRTEDVAPNPRCSGRLTPPLTFEGVRRTVDREKRG
jgi:hypothetical protein